MVHELSLHQMVVKNQVKENENEMQKQPQTAEKKHETMISNKFIVCIYNKLCLTDLNVFFRYE